MGFVKEQSCGIIPIFYKDGDFFILLVKGRHGHWGFPKGHIENGENCVVTAKREFTEETGIPEKYIQIDEKVYFDDAYWFMLKGNRIYKKVRYFLGYLKPGFEEFISPQQGEISEVKIIPIEEIYNYITFNSLKEIIDKLKEKLK